MGDQVPDGAGLWQEGREGCICKARQRGELRASTGARYLSTACLLPPQLWHFPGTQTRAALLSAGTHTLHERACRADFSYCHHCSSHGPPLPPALHSLFFKPTCLQQRKSVALSCPLLYASALGQCLTHMGPTLSAHNAVEITTGVIGVRPVLVSYFSPKGVRSSLNFSGLPARQKSQH